MQGGGSGRGRGSAGFSQATAPALRIGGTSVSRFNDISLSTRALTEASQLPAINWSLVAQSAPALVSVDYGGPGSKPPQADAIVMTWTSAEWAALDHIFVRSGKA